MCVFKLIFLYVLERDGGWLLMGLSSNMFESLIFLSSLANSSVMLSQRSHLKKIKYYFVRCWFKFFSSVSYKPYFFINAFL